MPYLLTSFLAILLALWAGSWTWAEFITVTPQKHLERWEQQESIDSHKAFEDAWDQLIKASYINPTSADYELALGRLALIKANEPDFSLKSKIDYQTLATTHLKQALVKRPSSGLAWSYLAKAVAKDETQSDLFIQAMTQSAILEPYEELNQKQIIPLAIKHWSCLPDSLKQTMRNIIQHGINRQPRGGKFIMRAAVASDWGHHLMQITQREWKIKWVKKRMLKKPQIISHSYCPNLVAVP